MGCNLYEFIERNSEPLDLHRTLSILHDVSLQGVVTLIGPVEPFATGIKMKSSDQEAI